MGESPPMIKRYITYDTLPVVNIRSIKTFTYDLDKKDESWKTKVVNFKRDLMNSSTPSGTIVYGKTVREVPNRKIKEITPDHVSALCSPSDCIKQIHKKIKCKSHKKEDVSQMNPVEGINRWDDRKDFAYGMAVSLYENDTETGHLIGDPVADSLAIITRRNCGILALADGVSWGPKSKLASNCGVYGSITYISKHIEQCMYTKDVFRCILRSFEHAQKCIVEEEATMTTLCVGVVVQLQEKDRFGFCVVNVGDSYAYVYSKKYGVKEVTHGSHCIDELRDMRYSGGALGPADGYNPDLGNLTCSFVVIEKGDVVFLCSDGISDNFDPAVAKFNPRFKTKEQTRQELDSIDGRIQKISDSKSDIIPYNTEDSKPSFNVDTPNITLTKLEQSELFANDKDGNLLEFSSTGGCGSVPSLTGSPTSSDEGNSLSSSPKCDHPTNLSSMDKKMLKSHECLSIKKMFDKFAKMESPDISSNEEDNAEDGTVSKCARNNTSSSDNNSLRGGVEKNCDICTDILNKNIADNKTGPSNGISCDLLIKRDTQCYFGKEYSEDTNNSVLEFALKGGNMNKPRIKTSRSHDDIVSKLHANEKDQLDSRPRTESNCASSNKNIVSPQSDDHASSQGDIHAQLRSKSHSNILKGSPTEQKDFRRTVSEQQHKKRPSLSDEILQSLTPRERHKGALEQMTEIIRSVEFEPIKGTCVHAVDVCAQIMNFVVNRTAEKRDILEETPPSLLSRWTTKERKKHNERVKKTLEGVPGKLDHASIVAYEVDVRGKEVVTLDSKKSSDSFDDISATEASIDGNPCVSLDEILSRRQSEPNDYTNERFNNRADRKMLYAYK